MRVALLPQARDRPGEQILLVAHGPSVPRIYTNVLYICLIRLYDPRHGEPEHPHFGRERGRARPGVLAAAAGVQPDRGGAGAVAARRRVRGGLPRRRAPVGAGPDGPAG